MKKDYIGKVRFRENISVFPTAPFSILQGISEWEDTVTETEVESPGKASPLHFPETQMPMTPKEGNKTSCKLEFSNVSNNTEGSPTELPIYGS